MEYLTLQLITIMLANHETSSIGSGICNPYVFGLNGQRKRRESYASTVLAKTQAGSSIT
jgi:hypothetical protein